MTTDTPPKLNGATLRVIAQSLGLHRAHDLAGLLDRNERTIKRWFTDERPISPDVVATVRGWQREMSEHVNAALDQVDTEAGAGEHEFVFTRFPNVTTLRVHHPKPCILTYSTETWDAYLGRVVAVLDDQGITYRIHTTGRTAETAAAAVIRRQDTRTGGRL